MKINMKDLASRGKPQHLEGTLDASRLVSNRRDVLQYTPVQAKLDANYMAGLVHVDGQLDGEFTLSCSRCLNDVKLELNIPFHEAFSKDERYDDENNEDDIFYVPHDEFDLVPYLEAAFLLELPLVALCRDDCRGLCPTCGTNRNEADCSCETERIDPRLADLQRFFDKKN